MGFKLKLALGLFLVVVLGIGGYFGLDFFTQDEEEQSEDYNQQAIDSGKKRPEVKKNKDGIYVVGWRILYQLDYKTGKAPKEVKKLHNEIIRIPGFIVPLSDDYTNLSEFLVVPDAQSCIHAPPPPPNLIIHVKLKEPIPVSEVFNPAWVTGKLKIEKTNNMYGAASYQMEGIKLEEFKY